MDMSDLNCLMPQLEASIAYNMPLNLDFWFHCNIMTRFQVKKKQFFRNFMTITLFGAIGTLISFAIISYGMFCIYIIELLFLLIIGFVCSNKFREHIALSSIISNNY